MLSGRRLDLLDPSPLDIEIEDIAHGLARVARWNGQTVGEHAFSVAQHALLVEEIAAAHAAGRSRRRWRLAALLHDAPEYVIGDMISPFKAAIGLDYKAFEDRLLERHPSPLRPAAVLPGRDQDGDQGGRPRRRLLRGDAAGGLHRSRGQPLLRRAARRAGRPARAPGARSIQLPVAVAQAAVSGAFQRAVAGVDVPPSFRHTKVPTGASTNAPERGPMQQSERWSSPMTGQPGKDGTVHVCPLSAVPDIVARSNASHLLTCLQDEVLVETPRPILPDRHLRLHIHDIAEPMLGLHRARRGAHASS